MSGMAQGVGEKLQNKTNRPGKKYTQKKTPSKGGKDDQ